MRPNAGPFRGGFLAGRRVPGTSALDYLALAPARAGPSDSLGEVLACRGPLYQRLLRPLFLAALNTEPREASAALAGGVVRETLRREATPAGH